MGWNQNSVWIGGTEGSGFGAGGPTEGLKWSDDSSVDFLNFQQDQPDANQEDCVVLQAGANGEWNNVCCGSRGTACEPKLKRPFICKAGINEPAWGAPLTLPAGTRRRMLLSTDVDKGASMAASSVSFKTSPKSMMASAFNVPEDRVATFSATIELTATEACRDTSLLQADLRLELEAALRPAASSFETVQVTKLSVDRAGVVCDDAGARRSKRLLLSSGATAALELLVVFSAGTDAAVNLDLLVGKAGIVEVDPLSVSEKVQVGVDPDVTEEQVEEQKKEGIAADDTSSSSSSQVPLIAGICGGVGVLFLVGAAVFLYSRGGAAEPQEAVPAVSLESLKVQLSNDV
mmetsp:Transcript_24081/g.48636  ORF Transcript_24081/g.48636 Transcript_24081/m.48636 type:complete len:347 (+) Transcript_24081:200-1240(+)